jgi:hypothetical protein
MSLGRHQREALTALLFAVALAMAGCGGNDAPRKTPSPERDAGTTAPAASPTETPAAEEEAQQPVAGPRPAAVMRRLDGRRIRVHGTAVVIDRDTLACGRARDAGGRRKRIRLRCVQPTFPAGSLVGPDATFFVHVNPAGRLAITGARLTSY